jgi:hypothetical protein
VATYTPIKGQTHQQSIDINTTPLNRSIMGRTYRHQLTDPDTTQMDTINPPLRYDQTKGLIGKHIDKMA